MEVNSTEYGIPNGKILIVDDVEINLYVAEGLIASYELQIETALSGYAAIDKITDGKVYDIIFMDHMMPGIDGIETTKKIRSLGYTGAIVALTANALSGNAEMFMQNGFDDFISKPIELRNLNTVLNKYVRQTGIGDQGPGNGERGLGNGAKGTGIDPRMLVVFLRDAKKAVAALEQTFLNGDTKLFTTTVHAMKSALANIGENEASLSAAALENAGLNDDAEFITANTDNFINTLKALIQNLSPAETAKHNTDDIQEDCQNDHHFDLAYLMEYLQVIKSACENYDDAIAYAALDRLKEKPWKKETSVTLEEIRDMLFLHSDFDEAAKQSAALIDAAASLRKGFV